MAPANNSSRRGSLLTGHLVNSRLCLSETIPGVLDTRGCAIDLGWVMIPENADRYPTPSNPWKGRLTASAPLAMPWTQQMRAQFQLPSDPSGWRGCNRFAASAVLEFTAVDSSGAGLAADHFIVRA